MTKLNTIIPVIRIHFAANSSRGMKTYWKKNLISGFSLMEVLVSIALLVTLTAISIPSLAGVIQKSQLTHAESALLRSLALARTAAMSHAKTVVMCARDRNQKSRCSSESNRRYAAWSNGWLVFVDTNNDGQLQKFDELINISMQQDKVGIVFNQIGSLRFNEMGRARSAGFYLCAANSEELTHIKLLHSGRYRSSVSTNSSHLSHCQFSLNGVENTGATEGKN